MIEELEDHDDDSNARQEEESPPPIRTRDCARIKPKNRMTAFPRGNFNIDDEEDDDDETNEDNGT